MLNGMLQSQSCRHLMNTFAAELFAIYACARGIYMQKPMFRYHETLAAYRGGLPDMCSVCVRGRGGPLRSLTEY